MAAHPLRAMLDAGLLVAVNSDDPPYFGGYVNDDAVRTHFDLDRAAVAALADLAGTASARPSTTRTTSSPTSPRSTNTSRRSGLVVGAGDLGPLALRRIPDQADRSRGVGRWRQAGVGEGADGVVG
jgi:hypothetical protein